MPLLNKALRALNGKFRHSGVLTWWTVEGGSDHLAVNTALHVSDFFGPLIDQHNHEVTLRVVFGNSVGNVLQNGGLTGLWRGNDQRALSLANRHDQVDHARSQDLRIGLQAQALIRIQRGELGKLRTLARFLNGHAIDGVHPH